MTEPVPAASAGSVWTRRIEARLRARAMRRFGVFGKDLAQFARVPLAMGVLAALVLITMAVMQRFDRPQMMTGEVVGVIVFGFVLTAFALGLAVTGEEEETETQRFLGRLPAHPLKLLAGKCAAGGVLLALWVPVMLLIACLLVPRMDDWEVVVAKMFARLRGTGFGFHSTAWFVVALYVTGLASGMWSRGRLVTGALVGGSALYVFPFLLGVTPGLVESREAAGRPLFWYVQVSLNLTLAHQVWTVLMVGALVLGGWRVEEGALAWWERMADAWSGRRERRKTRAPLRLDPARWLPVHAAFYAALGMAVMYQILRGTEYDLRQTHDLAGALVLTAIVATLAGAIVGAASLHRNERELAGGFVYALPVSVTEFHLARLKRLLAATAALGAAVALPWLFEKSAPPALFLAGAVGCVTGAFLGYWARLHMRSLIVALMLAAPVAAAWAAMVALRIAFGLRASRLPGESLLEPLFWPALVSIGGAFGLVVLTVRGTLVLEMNEAPRAWALVLGVLLVLTWGPLVIGMSVVDVWSIVFG